MDKISVISQTKTMDFMPLRTPSPGKAISHSGVYNNVPEEISIVFCDIFEELYKNKEQSGTSKSKTGVKQCY